MATKRNATKVSKYVSDEFDNLINETKLLKDFPKSKKSLKLQRSKNNYKDAVELQCDKSTSNLILASKKNPENYMEILSDEPRLKLLNVMNHQLETRKACDDELLKSLSGIITQLEADNDVMEENKKILEHLSNTILNYMQQGSTALKKKIKLLSEIHRSFKKASEDTETENKADTDNFIKELEQLRNKLVSETKRSGMESLRRTIFEAIEIDY